MQKNKKLKNLLKSFPTEIYEQLQLFQSIHNLISTENCEFRYEDISVYNKLLKNMHRVEGTSVGLYLPDTLSKSFNQLKEFDDIDDITEKLSEINFILGAFTDQMDDDHSFEEACEIVKTKKIYMDWYQSTCLMAGFEGIEAYDLDLEDEQEKLDFDPPEVIQKIVSIMEKHNLVTVPMSKKKKKELDESIRDSLFLESEGKKLALNVFCMVQPKACRIIDASDFINGTAEEVINSLSELFKGSIEIKLIDSSDEGDWGEKQDEVIEEDQLLKLTVELDGKTLLLNYSAQLAYDPLKVTNYLVDVLSENVSNLKERLCITRATSNIWSEDGAIILVLVPKEVKSELESVISET